MAKKGLSMRVGMKVVLYGCKNHERRGDYETVCDLANLESKPCGDLEDPAWECRRCQGSVKYTFKLVKKEVVK